MIDSESEAIAAAEARVGRSLAGKYKLERLLGIGGMASVYAATHRNQKRVAIKLLHPELSASPSMRARFLREGYVANSVGHPGAVSVLDEDSDEGFAFLVMELLDGESVERVASVAGGRLTAPTVLWMARSLLDVLHAAHAKGIVHRDIKPGNLFVTRDGGLRVLDFGIARLREASAPQTVTRTGSPMGTPAFMAPEQALGKSSVIGPKSDLWSVGATMFLLLSGDFVHVAESMQEMLVFAATRPARSLTEAAPDVPREVASLVDRALAFKPEERWESAASMRAAVDGVIRSLFQEVHPPALPVNVRITTRPASSDPRRTPGDAANEATVDALSPTAAGPLKTSPVILAVEAASGEVASSGIKRLRSVVVGSMLGAALVAGAVVQFRPPRSATSPMSAGQASPPPAASMESAPIAAPPTTGVPSSAANEETTTPTSAPALASAPPKSPLQSRPTHVAAPRAPAKPVASLTEPAPPPSSPPPAPSGPVLFESQ